MINWKRFLITFMTLCFANIVYAESCIMISDTEIKDIKCSDTSIINIKILTTLANEKRSIIVTSLKDGQAVFSVKIKNKSHSYTADVKNNRLKISGDNALKILSVDLPPEAIPDVPSLEDCKN